jgi:hypothetical protein
MSLDTKKITPFRPKATNPFEITVSSKADNPSQLIITVAPGTINNILPNNIIEGGKLKEFSGSTGSMQKILLQAFTNGKIINSAIIKIGTSDPKTQAPVAFGLPSELEVLIGVVYNQTVYQVVSSSLYFGARIQYVTKSNDPVLPFVPYLIWA